MEVKKPTTYNEQVEYLRDKGIVVRDETACKAFLNKVNYYRISGYFLPVFNRREDKSEITFDDIQMIYDFDCELRHLTLIIIERIEIYLRSQLSYYHAHKYGATGYLKKDNYNDKHLHLDFIKRIHSIILERRNSPVVQHHIEKYDNQFPIWVIIDFFSLGMLSYFYRGMKNNDKALIAKEMYGINYQTMQNWLHCLTNLRNCCAHYARLYYYKFPALPKVPKEIKYIATRRFFAQLYMLKWMYPEPERWNTDILRPLRRLLRKYKDSIDLKDLDFPYYWKSMLTYKVKDR